MQYLPPAACCLPPAACRLPPAASKIGGEDIGLPLSDSDKYLLLNLQVFGGFNSNCRNQASHRPLSSIQNNHVSSFRSRFSCQTTRQPLIPGSPRSILIPPCTGPSGLEPPTKTLLPSPPIYLEESGILPTVATPKPLLLPLSGGGGGHGRRGWIHQQGCRGGHHSTPRPPPPSNNIALGPQTTHPT